MSYGDDFKGVNLADAVRQATAAYRKTPKPQETKSRAQAWAPPQFWGPWVDIYTQLGVVGPNSDDHVTTVNVSFETRTRVKSSFDVQIRGGDDLVTAFGPGTAKVKITGNVATTLELRAKSHTVGQNILVDAN